MSDFPSQPPSPSDSPVPSFDGGAPPEAELAPVVDFAKEAHDTLQKFAQYREYRRPHEGGWYVNGAMLRNQQHVTYDDGLGRLTSPLTPSYRIQLSINKIKPKVRARLAKFFKNRPRAVVIPASTERKDILNARATEKFFSYAWEQFALETKYKDARLWAAIGFKAYWWLRWDKSRLARAKDESGQEQNLPIGDIEVEVGSPFEVFVADPAIQRMGQQPEIIRARLIDESDAKQRFPELNELKNQPEKTGSSNSISPYPDRLAGLRQSSVAGNVPNRRTDKYMMLEHFIAPCGKYPKGRSKVVIGTQCVKVDEELPYEMWDMGDNPYPCVDFTDQMTPGQYFGATFMEGLVDLQREYNFIRELVSENLRAVARPKIIIYKQHNLQDGAWTNASGEIVELSWIPGLPEPRIVQAANVANDAWNLLQLIDREFDSVSQIYPATEGKVADSTSGYQTNLLQEASESVHAPDIREDELAMQQAARKMRRLAKLGYSVPRLLAITGPNALSEVIEFHKDQINEASEVRIQVGSMLPDLKAARMQTITAMAEKGMFGNLQDPIVRRRVLSQIDMGGFDAMQEDERRDGDDADRENQVMAEGGSVKPAQFYEDSPMHIYRHQAYMKSEEFMQLAPELQQVFFAHVITHYDWVNPMLAMGLRQQYNLPQLPVATPPPPPMPMGGPILPPPSPGSGPAPTGAPSPSSSPSAPPAPRPGLEGPLSPIPPHA